MGAGLVSTPRMRRERMRARRVQTASVQQPRPENAAAFHQRERPSKPHDGRSCHTRTRPLPPAETLATRGASCPPACLVPRRPERSLQPDACSPLATELTGHPPLASSRRNRIRRNRVRGRSQPPPAEAARPPAASAAQSPHSSLQSLHSADASRCTVQRSCSVPGGCGRWAAAYYLSNMMRWWCWPPALPRPPGCFLCLPAKRGLSGLVSRRRGGWHAGSQTTVFRPPGQRQQGLQPQGGSSPIRPLPCETLPRMDRVFFALFL